ASGGGLAIDMVQDALTTKATAQPGKVPGRRRTAAPARAVVFADIVGANALYQALGDLRAMSLITRCLVAMEEQVYQHRGDVIKTVGEEMLVVFPEANAGATGVIAMQQRMEHFAADACVDLSLRVGLHAGPVIEDGGDVFGDSVN